MKGSDNCFFFFLVAVVTVDVLTEKKKKKTCRNSMPTVHFARVKSLYRFDEYTSSTATTPINRFSHFFAPLYNK